MPVITDSHATNETQKANGLIEQLQNAQDEAKELSDHNLRAWVVDCIENALKAPRREYRKASEMQPRVFHTDERCDPIAPFAA